MTYLLDTNIISYFLQAQHEDELAIAAKVVSMAIVDEVRKELEEDGTRGGPSFRRWLSKSNIVVHSISVGSTTAQTLIALSPQGPNGESIIKGLGERASTAIAAHDASLMLVTNDKNAAWMALKELWMPGDRVLRLPVFLRKLWAQSAIDKPSVLDDVMKKAHQRDEPWPTWWLDWFSTLTNPASTSPDVVTQ